MDYKSLIWYLRRAPNTNIGMTPVQPLEWDAVDAISDLLARAEAAETEAEQMRNDRMKIQYGGEELTVKELCDRLERAEARAEKKIKQLTPCDRCAYDPPSSGDGKSCSFCPESKKED